MNINITVNGLVQQYTDGLTISELLKSKELNALRVVVEVNKEIVKREKFDEYRLSEGDCVEVLRFVGGG